ncbi:hypothetical protein JCM9279_007307 [Rhodotorula babjevae]
MPAESYGVKLSLHALVKAWVDHHPGLGDHDEAQAERWGQSMLTLVDRYTAKFTPNDWVELEDEVERYREYLAEGAYRNSFVKTDEASMQHALPILSTLAGVGAAEERVARALSHAHRLRAGAAPQRRARAPRSLAHAHGPSHFKLQRSRPF